MAEHALLSTSYCRHRGNVGEKDGIPVQVCCSADCLQTRTPGQAKAIPDCAATKKDRPSCFCSSFTHRHHLAKNELSKVVVRH